MAGADVFTQLEETRLKELFDYLDEDHDGFVTHHDLRRLCTELGRDMAEERAAVSDPRLMYLKGLFHFAVTFS
jgi:EF-hand domain